MPISANTSGGDFRPPSEFQSESLYDGLSPLIYQIVQPAIYD